MEWSKVKNIIILILLLMNLFLLVLVGGQFLQERQSQRDALDNAAQILKQNGIVISQEALNQISSATLTSMTASRDSEAEAALAQALLGEDAVCTDQSGGLYVYTNGAGTALFRASGEFSVTFEEPPAAGSACSDHAEAFLQDLGLTGELIGTEEDASGTATVTFRQTLEDVPVYTCRIFFRYTEHRLESISGTLLNSTALISTGDTALDATTALIRFLSGILDSGDVCSSVTSVRPGYRMVPSFSAGMYLHPVWLVSTDASEYYLDGITGELSRVS